MKRNNILLIIIIVAKIIAQYFLINPVYDLQRDEFLHLDQAKHLAWGYESVPPFTSWISWIIMQLGNGVFWVKFFPALFGAATIAVVWKTAETLGAGLYALLLCAAGTFFSVLLRLNTLYQPNSFDTLCWTLLLFTLVKYIQSSNARWLWFAAITLAFGFLNKYNILFLVMGIVPALLLTKQRTIFLQKQLYFAGLLALVIVLPNLLWQVKNDFPVIHHMKELSETQLVNVKASDFLKEQVIYFIGAFPIILFAFWAFIFYQPFRPYRFVGLTCLFTNLVFIYFKGKGYYAIGLYPILIAFGAVYIEKLLQKKWQLYLRPVFFLVIAFCFWVMFKIAFPLQTPEHIATHNEQMKKMGLLRWEDGKDHLIPQDFADMLGWKEMAEKVDKVYMPLANKENVMIFCDNYGQAGAINYYSKVKNIGAVSFNADYINWMNLDGPPIKTIIRVMFHDHAFLDPVREKRLFNSVVLKDSITNPFAIERGGAIWLLESPKTDVNTVLKKVRADEKAREKPRP